MGDTTTIEGEALETYRRFVAVRDQIDSGAKSWSDLADFFSEDAAYIDPAWGRIDGRENIRAFFVESMAGLTGHGWSTPENWMMAKGPRLVSQWDQVLGHAPDGSPHFVAGSQKRFYGEMKNRAKSGPVTDLENDRVIAITAAGRFFVAESTGGDIRED